MPWLGRKKIAFIPLHRPNAHPPDDAIPADWPAETLRRVYYDPNVLRGLPDRSLRTYIHCVSSGLADSTLRCGRWRFRTTANHIDELIW
jgi:hypothetical protein